MRTTSLCLLIAIMIACGAQAQYPERRVTLSSAEEIRPQWGPFGDDIAFLVNDIDLSDNICCSTGHFNLGLVSANSPGSETLISIDLTPNPGLTRSLAWDGFSATLVLDEGEGIREFLRLNPYSSAPFPLVRSQTDGSEPEFEVIAFTSNTDVPGLLEISRDGSTALWASVTSASPNQIYSAPVSALKGISAFIPAQLEYEDSDRPVGTYVDASLTPDGTKFALSQPDPFLPIGKDLFIHEIGGLSNMIAPTQITTDGNDGVQNIDPEFSPDGSLLAFVKSDGIGGTDIYLYSFTEGLLQITNTPGVTEHHPTWSPDGTQLAFSRFDGPGAPGLLPGESPSVNIYVVDLPVSGGNIGGIDGPEIPLTPDIDITAPPLVIESGDPNNPDDEDLVIIQLPKYTLSSATISSGVFQLAARVEAAKKNKVFYEVEVESTDGSNRAKKFSKRNEVAFRNLPAGTYSTSYRVRSAKGRKSKKTSSKTRFNRDYKTEFKTESSPSAVFVRSGLK